MNNMTGRRSTACKPCIECSFVSYLSSYQFCPCDVTSWDQQLAAFKAAISKSPQNSLDIVVANAGIGRVDQVFQLGSWPHNFCLFADLIFNRRYRGANEAQSRDPRSQFDRRSLFCKACNALLQQARPSSRPVLDPEIQSCRIFGSCWGDAIRKLFSHMSKWLPARQALTLSGSKYPSTEYAV